jgi:hypothetical protein
LPPELLSRPSRLTVRITEQSPPSRAGRESPRRHAPSSTPELRRAVGSSRLVAAHRWPSLFSCRSTSPPAGPTAPRLNPSRSREHRCCGRFTSARAPELCQAPSQGRPRPPSPRSPDHPPDFPSRIDLEPMVRTSILPLTVGADASLAVPPSAVCVSTSAGPAWPWASQLCERATQCRVPLLCCWATVSI